MRAAEGAEVTVKPPALETPGMYVSSHWPGINYPCIHFIYSFIRYENLDDIEDGLIDVP